MEQTIGGMETLLHEKILLYQELVETLTAEKTCLKKRDVDGLWRLAEKKQALAVKIEAARTQILQVLEQAGIQHAMSLSAFSLTQIIALLPPKAESRFKGAFFTLTRLKDEVAGLARGNKTFVNEYLQVLDELIGIMSRTEKAQPVYGRNRYTTQRAQTRSLIHREV